MARDKSERQEEALYQLVKENMQRLRKQYNLTQAEMAAKLGITMQHYQQMETGKTPPNLRIIAKMCQAFNVHPSYFFSTTDLSVIDADGKILLQNLSTDDIAVLRSAVDLPSIAKQSILEFIRFQSFRMAEQMQKRKPSL